MTKTLILGPLSAFTGNTNKLLNLGLSSAGIDRDQCRVASEYTDLGDLSGITTIISLGADAMMRLIGVKPPTNMKGDGFIREWRGSILPVGSLRHQSKIPEQYLWRAGLKPLVELLDRVTIVPTLDPVEVNRDFESHPFFLLDLKKAGQIVLGMTPTQRRRQWFMNQPDELSRLDGVDLIAVDSEISPPIISLTTEDEVHVFDWNILDRNSRGLVRSILESPKVLKVAHNWNHDHAWFRVQCGIIIQRPYFDTYGGAHILNSGLSKDLSPSISTRYTDWPYHKWLVDHDPLLYCGMDGVVTYDSYWPIWEDLSRRDLLKVAEHDHRLLTPLLDMTAYGFKINEPERQVVEAELAETVKQKTLELQELVRPVIADNITKFEKPHLFRVKRKCPCCGGGKTQCIHCFTCFKTQPDKYGNYIAWIDADKITRDFAQYNGFKTIKAMKEALPVCRVCEGSGKVDVDLPFNPDSSDQVADVVYKGLNIRPRKFKGKVTTKAASLEAIKDKHIIIERIVDFSESNAELDTVKRLTAGFDNRLHCVLDPWGTTSGRVAGKEGLVEVGTNPMNIPVPARRLIVPDDGYVFLYPDMNAIEARAVAVISKDAKLLDAFSTPIDWPGNERHGEIDSHTRVMQLLLEEAGVEINRDGVKRLTYAGIYGGEPPQVTKEINAEMMRKKVNVRYTEQQIDRAMTAFFRVFSGIDSYRQRILKEVYETKRLRCPLTGREFTWNGRVGDRKTGEISREIKKQIWSRLPQNMAAWVLALGLQEMYYKSDVYGTLLRPQIHVHDALLMQAKIADLDLAKEAATHYLTRTEWGMEFPCKMKTGMNWLEASGG